MINRKTLSKLISSRLGVYSKLYDTIMIIAIIAAMIPLVVRESSSFTISIDSITCIIFIIDYLLRWTTADVGSTKSKTVAFLSYPFSLMAIIDLLSIIPSLGLFNPSLKLFRVTRLFKILRIFKFIRYYRPMRVMITVMTKEGKTLLTVFSFAVFYIFVTALIMFNSEKAVDPETGKYVFDTFFDSLYWAACTLTTVGYGDICPVSGIGRLISMVSAMVGVAIIALPSGIITASYLEELNKDKKDHKE